MGASEEVMAHNSYDEDIHGVVKGKRTKRRRTHRLSSPPVTTVLSISSAEDSASATEEEEEEDLANCLILLAQGRGLDTSSQGDGEDDKFSGQKIMEAATIGKENQNASNYGYRCRTCNKCFSSFQALGGHRTSHKRPKTAPVAAATMAETERKKAAADEYDLKVSVASYPDTSGSGTVAAGTITAAGKLRSHECSVCGLEFSSGQALGGHMRRHRPAMIPVFPQEVKKEKNVFALDLNLPAPSHDEHESSTSTTTFAFVGKRPLHFPALVDCLY